MLRRSDFIAATYALSFVLANFGIAIAARMPMITTTIRSSIRVKPFLLRSILIILEGKLELVARRQLRRRKCEDNRQAISTRSVARLCEASGPHGLEERLRRGAVRRACSREEQRVARADADVSSGDCIRPGQIADRLGTAVCS